MPDALAPTPRLELPGFTGAQLRPGGDGYDDARKIFNGMIDRRPAVIARAANADDVVAAVNFARERALPLAVYGGGHGVTGSALCDDGVCIDLRGLNFVEVDPVAKTARVGGGANWGEVDAATQEHGLAVTGGRVTHTGVAGLVLGSGSGWLERKLGLTCDSLISADVVTADGRKVVASEDENPDLFWGIRGGGGNFGVATSFEFRLHEVGPIVLGGMIMYPAAMARDVTRAFRELMLAAPDELGTAMAYITAPPLDFVPEPIRGKPVVGILVCWSGDIEAGQQAIAPLVELAPPGAAMVQPMPYVAVQQLLDPPNQKGFRNYWSADFLAELPDEAIETLIAHATNPASPMGQVILAPGGGAIARVPDDAMAFGERRSPWNVHYLTMWDDPADDEKCIAYTRAIAAAMKPWASGRAYLNFIGDEGGDRVKAAFGPERYARLQEIKRAWDPENLFRLNQNIPPS
jgi:FAD/FMN-containing dehydrogenase